MMASDGGDSRSGSAVVAENQTSPRIESLLISNLSENRTSCVLEQTNQKNRGLFQRCRLSMVILREETVDFEIVGKVGKKMRLKI